MRSNGLKWAGFALLLWMLTVFGLFMVPAHLTSLWMDREFTDWISPIANRLHGSARLYGDGLHLPLPPLPYVLVRLLHPAGAIWIQESLLFYFFQAATLLLLYCLLFRQVGVGLAFAACMAALPVFLSLEKSILYDSMAQFLVAAGGGVCAGLIQSVQAGGDGRARGLAWCWLALQGWILGLLMLCKQSTGLGTFLGVCLALLVLPGRVELQRRCLSAVLVALFTAATVVVVALVLSKFVSFPGMIQDVFLNSSEPKGGSGRMLMNLAQNSIYLAKRAAAAAVLFYALSWLFRRQITWRNQTADVGIILNLAPYARAINSVVQARAVLLVFVTSGLSVLAVCAPRLHEAIGGMVALIWTGNMPVKLLDLALVPGVVLVAGAIIHACRGKSGGLGDHPLAPYCVVFLMAALFHSLSVAWFRWTYDNNPLIVLALVFLFSPLVIAQGTARKWAANVATGLLCACVSLMWTFFFWPCATVRSCTESWPEIRHLAGARLRPDCEGMRESRESRPITGGPISPPDRAASARRSKCGSVV